ncbi:MAG: hypothetical protein ACR2PY_07950 [Salinispira sp.]
MKKLMPLFIVVVAITVLAGCPMEMDEPSPLVGTWIEEYEGVPYTVTFTATKIKFPAIVFFEVPAGLQITCDYEDNGDSITVSNCEGLEDLSELEDQIFKYTISDNTLMFADSRITDFTLTRQ